MLEKIYSILFHFARLLPGSVPKSLDCRLRIALLRRLAAACVRDINVPGGVQIGVPYNLTIGDNSAIGLGCYLSSLDKETIGDRVLMGPQVMIHTSNDAWSQSHSPILAKVKHWPRSLSRLTPG